MDRLIKLILLVGALVALSHAQTSVYNGQEYLYNSGVNVTNSFYCSVDGSDTNIQVLGFFPDAYYDLYCALGFAPTKYLYLLYFFGCVIVSLIVLKLYIGLMLNGQSVEKTLNLFYLVVLQALVQVIFTVVY